MGSERLFLGFSGIDLVVIILCDGIPIVERTCTFTLGLVIIISLV